MSDEGAVFQDSPREMADGEFSDASLYDTLRTPVFCATGDDAAAFLGKLRG